MAYTIEDYIKAQQAVQQAQQTIEIATANADVAASAFTEGQAGKLSPARLQVLQEDAAQASAQATLASISAKKAIEGAENQATRKNLEEMLDGMSAKNLKGFVSTYTPSFDDQGKFIGPNVSYEDAAELHADAAQMGNLLRYANSGETNTKTNRALDAVALKIIREEVQTNPKKYLNDLDPSDPNFDGYVKASIELDFASPQVRREDFEKFAPEVIKKRQKEMYKEIRSGTAGSATKDDIKSYITGSIADADIKGAFDGYANAYIKAQQANQGP